MIRKHKSLITRTLIIIAVLVAMYFFLPKLIMLFAPFIFAYIVASLVNPVVCFLTDKVRMSRAISALVTLILTLGVIGGFLFIVVRQIAQELFNLSQYLPTLYITVQSQYLILIERLSGIYSGLPENVRLAILDVLNNMVTSLITWAQSLSHLIMLFARNFVSSLPGVLVGIIAFILSTYFMLADKSLISSVIIRLTPKKLLNRLLVVKKDLIFAFGGYIKTQLIIMSITSTIMMISFSFLKIEYALLAALTIALFDAMPIFGSGAILLPWSIISFLNSDIHLSTGILIIYLLIIITRQVLEPKLFSDRIGLHPLITLMGMYVGLSLFGFLGLIFAPITVMIIKNLAVSGLFDKWLHDIKNLFESGENNE